MQQTERRRHERRPVDVAARMELQGYIADGTLIDIGAGGLRFRTDDTNLIVQAGNYVFVHFDVERDGVPESLRRPVRIQWTSQDGDSREFGMKFDELLALVDITL